MNRTSTPKVLLGLAGLAAVALISLACSSDTPAGDGGAPDAPAADGATDSSACSIPAYVDDIVLDRAAAAVMPAAAVHAAASDTHAFVCGAGYVAALAAGATAALVHDDSQITAPCSVAVSGARVVIATRAGALIALRFDGSTFSAIGSLAKLAPQLFDVALDGDTVWVAAGARGVLALSLANDALSAPTTLPGARDAHGVARTAAGDLLVADGHVPGEQSAGGGAQIRLISASGAGVLGELTELSGLATRALVDGDRALVLRPGHGFDVLDVAASKLALRYSTVVDRGLPYDGLLEGETLLVAAGAQLLRYRLGQSAAELVSREDRPDLGSLDSRWYRSVVRVGSGAQAQRFALTDGALVPLTLGAGVAAPAVGVGEGTITLVNGQKEALFKVFNFGNAPLLVSGLEADAPFSVEVYSDVSTPRPGCPTQYLVAPDDVLLGVHRTSATNEVTASIRIVSNDPGQPTLTVRGEANRPEAAVGDSVDDFALLTVRGRRFVFAEQRGKAILAKLYNKT